MYVVTAANHFFMTVCGAVVCNDNLQSFLCLTNKLAKEDIKSYDLKLIKSIGKDIIKVCKKSYMAEKIIECIDSDNFEEKKLNLLED